MNLHYYYEQIPRELLIIILKAFNKRACRINQTIENNARRPKAKCANSRKQSKAKSSISENVKHVQEAMKLKHRDIILFAVWSVTVPFPYPARIEFYGIRRQHLTCLAAGH